MDILLKDDKLSLMYEEMQCNIARFISISPDMQVKHLYLCNNYKYKGNLKECILDLIKLSNLNAVNIRSFSSESMKGNNLVYGKTSEDIDEIIQIIYKNCSENKTSIINETIDINDGGVSGVVLGNIIEFAPNDTPKCVEKPDVCLLDLKMGLHMLKTVYGFEPKLKFNENYRVEFSLHPKREGVKKEHTIIWEYEKFKNYKNNIKIKWPNKFSKFIGDKTFGLIVADYLGFNVPYTTVISRNIAPFSFGKKTNLNEKWLRTAPMVKEPGKYFTTDKWIDPFLLVQKEESKGKNKINISSILCQDAVESIYSGGAIISKNKKNDVIEGVRGKGDKYMIGSNPITILPNNLTLALNKLIDRIHLYTNLLGEVSIEWVYDGEKIWIVQLNQLNSIGFGNVIVFGKPDLYEKFYVEKGLEELRNTINRIIGKNIGIELVGDVGICSHMGDLLRQANIPSFITKN